MNLLYFDLLAEFAEDFGSSDISLNAHCCLWNIAAGADLQDSLSKCHPGEKHNYLVVDMQE